MASYQRGYQDPNAVDVGEYVRNQYQFGRSNRPFHGPSPFDYIAGAALNQYIGNLDRLQGNTPDIEIQNQFARQIQQETRAASQLQEQRGQQALEAERLRGIQKTADAEYERAMKFILDPKNGVSQEEAQQIMDSHAKRFGTMKILPNPVMLRKVEEEADNKQVKLSNAARGLAKQFGVDEGDVASWLQYNSNGELNIDKVAGFLQKQKELEQPNVADMGARLREMRAQLTAIKKDPRLYNKDGSRKERPGDPWFGDGKATPEQTIYDSLVEAEQKLQSSVAKTSAEFFGESTTEAPESPNPTAAPVVPAQVFEAENIQSAQALAQQAQAEANRTGVPQRVHLKWANQTRIYDPQR